MKTLLFGVTLLAIIGVAFGVARPLPVTTHQATPQPPVEATINNLICCPSLPCTEVAVPLRLINVQPTFNGATCTESH